jgi:hypothetical protein
MTIISAIMSALNYIGNAIVDILQTRFFIPVLLAWCALVLYRCMKGLFRIWETLERIDERLAKALPTELEENLKKIDQDY